MGSSDLAAAPAADVEILTQLEQKVEAVLRALAQARSERDAIRADLAVQIQRCQELETSLASAEGGREALRRMETERDALARERAGIARRIEGILERLELVGFE